MKQRQVRKAVRKELNRYNTRKGFVLNYKVTLGVLLAISLGIVLWYSAGSTVSYKNDNVIEDTESYDSKFIEPSVEVTAPYEAPSFDDAKDYNVIEDAVEKVSDSIYEKLEQFENGDFLKPESSESNNQVQKDYSDYLKPDVE